MRHGAADRLGEGWRIFSLVEDVTAASALDMVEVITNEGANGLAFFRVKVEAGEQALGELDAGGAVCSPLRRALPVSCKQQG